MKSAIINFLVEATIALFVLVTVTGVIIRYIPTPGAGHYSNQWPVDQYLWIHLHLWLAVILLMALMFHLMVHRKSIARSIRRERYDAFGAKLKLVIVVIVGLLTLVSVSFFFSPVEQVARPKRALQHLQIKRPIPEPVTLEEAGLFPDFF